MEGWSEALAAEVAPFGISVVVVEPGAFRTGFNGSGALQTSPALPAYAEQMTALRRTFETEDGQQPGDPAKAAAAVLHAVGLERPPLHVALDSDAVDALAAELDRQRAELEQWASLSRSTAVDA